MVFYTCRREFSGGTMLEKVTKEDKENFLNR